ncbi:MAG: preprotein translocase subunit Sec61beta [Candidatus Nanohalobium sp.]
MAKNDNQMQMPSSQGGLVQYFDADEGIELDPKAVVAFTIMVAVIEIVAHMGLV